MDLFATLAERKIQEAINRGGLDNLALNGQPIPPEEFSNVPPELRMGFKILKNAGMLPEEAQLKKDLLTLSDLMEGCRDPEEREILRKRLTAKRLHFDLLMERNGARPGYRCYAGKLTEKLGR
jgi:hypothetical protein